MPSKTELGRMGACTRNRSGTDGMSTMYTFAAGNGIVERTGRAEAMGLTHATGGEEKKGSEEEERRRSRSTRALDVASVG